MVRIKSVKSREPRKTAPSAPPKLKKKPDIGRAQIVAPKAWVQKIEEWRRAQPKIPSQSAAIRHLVEIGLAADVRGKKGA